ncbi:MAG: alpha-1,4-glucan--maltose-1-phosphate maltosyltransferase [Chloroflexota bacterium]|nr:alpha-1,4-glucan--maltose-1-phosphate maltosyltransferase [Chloroflexota bacterium]
MPDDGRRRVVIENVTPSVDGGRFAVKRTVGDELVVEADAFADGHEEIRAVLRWARPGSEDWHETEMVALGNDRWRAVVSLDEIGRWRYDVAAWVDSFRTWQHDLQKRIAAGQDVTVDLLIGADLVEAAAGRAGHSAPADAMHLTDSAGQLRAGDQAAARDARLTEIVERHPDRTHETTLDAPLELVVDLVRARFSAWYEMFPRSASSDPARHGTFRDVIARLPYVEELGFDVLYLPPVHPIGRQFRKGPNNVTQAAPSDPGVPWAIGGPEGGHTAVHPDLGSLDDFRALVDAAGARGIEIALDIAFQASPDHPWVTEHPTWFRARPDGTIQYAENPPKKYQDIYPFDFESEDWRGLWQALHDVFEFWIGHGVRIFRVDNPHTKAFAFWEWCIGRLKANHPEVLFLSEAFTRPKVMYRLAKLGFSQSYTYFTWRNEKQELTDYLVELSSPPVSEFFRPNFWPNTPDILHAYLQTGGRPAFIARAVMAATMTANYGIYGPAFELGENFPREPGSEEYLNSEKYEQRTWDLDRPDSLRPIISALNRARREHRALQANEGVAFYPIDNPQLLAYSKQSADGSDMILVVVNLDPFKSQAGALTLPWNVPVVATDLLTGESHAWPGNRASIELDPARMPAHVFIVERV